MNKSIFSLPELPYAQDALEPYISANTLNFHHKKHHQAYVNNLNALLVEMGWLTDSLESIIMQTYNKIPSVFNNAGQVWNHTFYWNSMKPDGGKEPTGVLREQIDKQFGSFDKFKEEFIKIGISQFGSGWVWLVWDNKQHKLEIASTSNAEMPMLKGNKALITSDLWEHAYYLDYQNRRADYLKVFLENLVNWDFAIQNLQQ